MPAADRRRRFRLRRPRGLSQSCERHWTGLGLNAMASAWRASMGRVAAASAAVPTRHHVDLRGRRGAEGRVQPHPRRRALHRQRGKSCGPTSCTGLPMPRTSARSSAATAAYRVDDDAYLARFLDRSSGGGGPPAADSSALGRPPSSHAWRRRAAERTRPGVSKGRNCVQSEPHAGKRLPCIKAGWFPRHSS